MAAEKKAIMERRFLFSSESVNEGHPDKLCDQVSDAVLDFCLTSDPKSKVACETATKDNMVMVAGEITTQAKIDYEKVVRGEVVKIGRGSKGLLRSWQHGRARSVRHHALEPAAPCPRRSPSHLPDIH